MRLGPRSLFALMARFFSPLLVIAAASAVLSAEVAHADGRSRSAVHLRPQRTLRRRALAFQMERMSYERQERVSGEQPWLLQFTGKGDDYCKIMEPMVAQLEKELGVEVRKLEVWTDPKHAEFLRRLDAGRCGGVPFFYNKVSKRHICGATTYDNLKDWAMGNMCDPILPPPEVDEPPTSPLPPPLPPP